jgi:hypothetical protein
MQKGAYLVLLLLTQYAFSQDRPEGAYADYGSSEGITIYGDRERIERENEIIAALNKGQKERREFIEDALLRKSGFGRTANVRFRNTTAGEKSVAVVQGILHAIFRDLLRGALGIIPMKPFLEEEYDRLPKGEFYDFYSILINSDLKDVSLTVQSIMELEYKLQVEFSDAALIENWNVKYYTEKNIAKFEQLILSLPDSIDDIRHIKERFLTIELPRIKSALYRYLHPSELYIQARKNLSDSITYNE